MMSAKNALLYGIILLIGCIFATANVYSAPILRIEVGQHTAMINRMAIDKEAKLLATVADDKTLRLWNLPEGTLYATLRVPIDEHLKGALYAVAVSPDGKTVITAGETIDEQQQFSLYVFDVEKRVLKARISKLPSAIFHLAYSKDGTRFAAAFAGGFGLRVWDSQTGKQLAQDTDYPKRSNWLDFNASGQLATVSHDGYVRLYDPHFSLLKKVMPNPQGQPSSVSFSDNGQLLAIGYANLLQVDILDLNLQRVHSLATEQLDGTNTAIVNWQKNSNTALYAAGDMKTDDGHFVISHWQGIGTPEQHYSTVAVSENIVTDIISLPAQADSKIDTLFSSADPSWGGLKNDQIVYKNQADLWDARLVELPDSTFAVSNDGLKIAYSQRPDSTDVSLFDASQMLLQKQADTAMLSALSPPLKETPRIKISNWQRDVPILNGVKLQFEEFETAFALALDPSSDHALIGTNYALRWYDGHGQALKKITVPAAIYAVNITANGKLAVAALGDGSIRWYSLAADETLEELAALFPYRNSQEWIIWTKEGFFGSSDSGGYRLAGYHLNKGENKRPEWIEFSQVYQTYYAPELIVAKLLRKEHLIQDKLKQVESLDKRFNKNTVPIIELGEYCISPKTATTKAFVRVSATPAPSTTQLNLQDKLAFYLQAVVAWVKSWFNGLFMDKATNPPPLVVANPPPPQCYAIAGQGQTRGFVRKAKTQAAVYRNQLNANTDTIDLHYTVTAREGGVGDIDVYVNGQIQHSQKHTLATATDTNNKVLKLSQTVTLAEGENQISIHAYEKTGGTSAISDSIALINPSANQPLRTADNKPKLIVLAVGIDHYGPPNDLRFAVKDSSDFLATVSQKKSMSYHSVVPFQLMDQQATLPNIEATFEKMAAITNKDDTVLIYLSGHGLRESNNFYFIPYQADSDNLSTTALSQDSLKKNIAKLAKTNRIFIFLDSCHSGAVDLDGISQDVTSFDKIKHQLGDNVFILAASAENQEAQDQFLLEGNIKPDNGLFAYAVLEGLKGNARRVEDNIVDNFGLGTYVQRRIDNLTKNQTLYKQKARFQMLEAGDILNFDLTHYE